MAGRWEQLIAVGKGDTIVHRGLTKPSEQTFGTGGQDSCFSFADEEDKAKRLSGLPWIAVV